jgi:hypothetical protein
MTHDDAMKHLVTRYTAKYEGKWGITSPTVLTQEDFEAWECLREHVDVIKEIDAKFSHIDKFDDDEDGIVGMI